MKLKLGTKKLEIIEIKNMKDKLFGALKNKENCGFLYLNCHAIHTFFQKEEIDVVGISEENQVLYIYRNVPKYKLIRIQDKQKKTHILKLPKNMSQKIVVGSILKFDV